MLYDKIKLHIDLNEDTNPADYINATENAERIRSLYDEVFRKYIKYAAPIEGVPPDVTSDVVLHLWRECWEHFGFDTKVIPREKPKKASLFERMKRWMSRK